MESITLFSIKRIVFLRLSRLYKPYATLSSHSPQGLSSTLDFMLTPPAEEFQS